MHRVRLTVGGNKLTYDGDPSSPAISLLDLKIHLKDTPNKVVIEYSLLPIADASGYVYVDIRKGMYGLKETGIIAYKRLVRNLHPHGYVPVAHTRGIWTHSTCADALHHVEEVSVVVIGKKLDTEVVYIEGEGGG